MTSAEPARTGPPAAERALLLAFCAFALASFAYCLATGEYNGDFFLVAVTLGPGAMILALLLTLLPYGVAWWMYRRIGTGGGTAGVPTPAWFPWLALGAFAWYALTTVAFGVGVMTREVYTAPAAIRPLIQITNRIDPFCLGMMYILASPRKARHDVPAVLAMVALGFLRAGLGSFLYVGIALGFKYFDAVARSRKKILAVVAVLAVGIPAATGTLYAARSSLRDEMEQELAIADLIFARLVGRLSSFSDTAFILQERRDLSAEAERLDLLYYQRQMLGSLVHGDLFPENTPERILVTARTGLEIETVGFMPGVGGNLILALLRSPLSFLLALATFLAAVAAVLWTATRFASPGLRASGILLLLYPLTSGVSYELVRVLVTMLAVLALFWLAVPRPADAQDLDDDATRGTSTP